MPAAFILNCEDLERCFFCFFGFLWRKWLPRDEDMYYWWLFEKLLEIGSQYRKGCQTYKKVRQRQIGIQARTQMIHLNIKSIYSQIKTFFIHQLINIIKNARPHINSKPRHLNNSIPSRNEHFFASSLTHGCQAEPQAERLQWLGHLFKRLLGGRYWQGNPSEGWPRWYLFFVCDD